MTNSALPAEGDETGHSTETEHLPVEVWSVDGMPFVRCSCGDLTSGSRPQSAVWLREHWQGTRDDGVAALRAAVARQGKVAACFDAKGSAPCPHPSCACIEHGLGRPHHDELGRQLTPPAGGGS